MAKLIASDSGVRGVDIKTERGTYKYNPDKKGVINVENPRHAAQMKAEGFFEASLMGATTRPNLGFTCGGCGFGSWFKKCSRCGYENKSRIVKDGE